MMVTCMAVRSDDLSPKSVSGTGVAIHTSQCSASTAIATHQMLRGKRAPRGRDDRRLVIDSA
ncbi:hypothetical protein PHO31112_02942 [Pandoraea horticolens]|uniref:Uncharacterized protein n=1 Tax=Pandoraea horticolens TaxID=2508298 RepID=A0A5E4W0H0_9BURK|nr:hypothetical protein PHO31112_02942 [Pandoraea horticolens]